MRYPAALIVFFLNRITLDELPQPGIHQRMRHNRCKDRDQFYRYHLLKLPLPGTHLCRIRKLYNLL